MAGPIVSPYDEYREETFVRPFYLKLMRTNATWIGHEVWDDLVAVGRTATLDDVIWLLRVRAWRPVVMGAWLSLQFGEGEVGAPVLDALQNSAGSLTAPPLAVSAVVVVGRDASTALRQSQARYDPASVSVLDAALEFLGDEPIDDPSNASRSSFAELVAFGERLRDALTTR